MGKLLVLSGQLRIPGAKDTRGSILGVSLSVLDLQ